MARSTTEMAARGRPEVLISFYGSSQTRNKGRRLPTFSAVEHGSSEHLIPHFVGISRILADDESFEMLFDEPTGGGATETSRITDSTIRGMYLHYNRRYMVSGGSLMRICGRGGNLPKILPRTPMPHEVRETLYSSYLCIGHEMFPWTTM